MARFAVDGCTVHQSKNKINTENNSLNRILHYTQSALRSLENKTRYDQGDPTEGLLDPLNLIHLELRSTRALYPELPVYLVKTDLRNFYPGLSHELILELLRAYGFAKREQQIIQQFLSIPLHLPSASHPNQTLTAQRGVPLGFLLSDLLAEWVMRLLERQLWQIPEVQVIRMRDDICLMGTNPERLKQALAALEGFCQATQLATHPDKTGSICIGEGIGGQTHPDLPTGKLCWGLLELDSQGDFVVNPEAFATHVHQSRRQVAQAHTLLGAVQAYNANLTFLFNAVSGSSELCKTHRLEVNAALRTFSQDFFGAGQSIEAGLKKWALERFFPPDLFSQNTVVNLPLAWLYWPVTAGGLGLQSATLLAHIYQKSAHIRQEYVQQKLARVGQLDSDGMGYFFEHALEFLQQHSTQDSVLSKSLVNDFIQRGKVVSSGAQEDLSPYWHWVLASYGPQILEQLGGFRFLPTSLVPVPLIRQHLNQGIEFMGESINESNAQDMYDSSDSSDNDLPF
jgi:hypothetical protein